MSWPMPVRVVLGTIGFLLILGQCSKSDGPTTVDCYTYNDGTVSCTRY